MAAPTMDADALIEMFQTATTRSGEQLRQAVAEATLRGLQTRALTMKNIRGTLKSVGEAASLGAAQNTARGVDPAHLLEQAVAGMDDALLRAVEAQRTALGTLAAQGADLRDKHLRKAMDDLEKMEDALADSVRKMARNVPQMEVPGLEAMAAPWKAVLDKVQAGGSASGATAAASMEQLMAQMQQGARDTRRASLKAVEALAEGYAAMVSGVLIGMSEALRQGAAGGAAAPAPAADDPASRRRR
jgi:rubrerythrin